MKGKIIVALDVDRLDEAVRLVDLLPEAEAFKVGLQSFLGFGEPLLAHLRQRRKRIFLDLKFHDIPNTVAGAVRSMLRFGPTFLTVHLAGGGEMISQALAAAVVDPGLTVLGVTVLTSLGDADLRETGVSLNSGDAVLKLCELGVSRGLRGVVCSPLEIAPIRSRFGRDLLLVTPGIRPAGSKTGDQKRVFTPAAAVRAGSDFLVIGRPIIQAADPAAAFQRIVEEISAGGN